MHFMHILWLFGKFIGLFHGPAVVVISVMLVVTAVMILVFYKIFEGEFFGRPSNPS
jgi:hypothetical protein